MRNQYGQFTKGNVNPGSVATQFKPGEHWRDPKPYWDRDWLYEEYAVKQRSAPEIAADFDCSPNNIVYFLHKHGIETRTTSETRAIKYWGLGGEQNGMFGKRGPESANWKGGTTPERQALYSSIEWCDAVKAIWARDNASCQRCGKKSTRERGSFHIHHIASFSDAEELRADPDNLILFCRECHLWVHGGKNVDKEFIKEVVPNGGDIGKRKCVEDPST